MKNFKMILTVLIFSFTLSLPAFSIGGTNPNWDGFVSCNITRIDVTGANNYGFRVHTDAADLLNDTDTTHTPVKWAYINESDSNYKTYVAMLSLAFTMGYRVVLYTKEKVHNADKNSYFAHIRYVAIVK